MALNNLGININIVLNAGAATQQANQAAAALNNVGRAGTNAARGVNNARKIVGDLAGAFVQMGVGQKLIGMFGAMVMKSDEVTMGMQRIKAVMGDGVFGVGGEKRVQDTIMKVAETTGKSFADVATATKDLIAQGLSPDQVLAMIEPVMKFSRAGEVSAEQTTKLVVALTNLGITGKATSGAFDIILNLANKSSLQVEDFASIVTKAGSVASLTGIGFKDLAAGITLTRKAFTSASEQGTALANTMMFISRPKTVGKIKEAFGVNVMDEATGKLRPMLTLFKEVSQAISSGRGTFGDLFTIMGGRTGAKVFTAGVNAFAQGQQFNEKQMKGDELFGAVLSETDKSGGAVESAFSKQMQALTPQLDRLKVAFDDLMGTLGQSFTQSLGQAVGAIADLFTSVRMAFDDPALKGALTFIVTHLGKIALAAGVALTAIGGFRIFKLALTPIISMMPGAVAGFAAMSAGVRAFGFSFIFTAGAAKLMWRAILGPIGLLIAAIEFLPSIINFFKGEEKGATGLGKGMSEAADANNQAASKMADTAKSLEAVTKEFNTIVAQYTGLAIKEFPKLDPRNIQVARDVLTKAGKQNAISDEGLFPLRDAISSMFSEARSGGISAETFKAGSAALQQAIGFAAQQGDTKSQKQLTDLLKNMENMAGKEQILFTKRLGEMKQGIDITVPGSKPSVAVDTKKQMIDAFLAGPGAHLNRMHPVLARLEAEKILNSRGIGPFSVAQTMAIQSAEINSLKINAPLELRIGNEQALPGVLRTLDQHDDVVSGESQ